MLLEEEDEEKEEAKKFRFLRESKMRGQNFFLLLRKGKKGEEDVIVSRPQKEEDPTLGKSKAKSRGYKIQ